MDAGEVTGAAVAKRLASCSKATRERAIRYLMTWLPSSSSTTVSDDDLLKIWKGLFYCVWHADKLPVQIDLIDRLSTLLVSLEVPLASRYFFTFLYTIRREWSGIDHLRLDKFYLLVRRFINKFFLLMSTHKWDLEVVKLVVEVLAEKSVLLVDDKYPAQGINYHISQVYLDEIKEFLPVSEEVMEILLRPFFGVLESSKEKFLVKKVKNNVFGRLLECGIKYLEVAKTKGGDSVEKGGEVEKLARIALTMGFGKRFFTSASAPGTVQGNRKVLFELHQAFLKLEKDLESSGVKALLEMENRSSDSSEHVEVVPAMIVDVPSSKKSSKEKMSKKALSTVGKKSKSKKKVKDSGPVVDVPSSKKSSKEEKSKKASSTVGKKSKSKKKVNGSGSVVDDGSGAPANGSIDGNEDANGNAEDSDDCLIQFNEVIMSNLQQQFESVAAEAGMVTPVASTGPKNRKRLKSADKRASSGLSVSGGGDSVGKEGERSAKRVRFSMKNNLIWKPQNPLPPQNLRLPPSATPRGSALKKGISPGPVSETLLSSNSNKKTRSKPNSAKKVRKSAIGVSPAVKCLRKLQSYSA